MKARLDRRTRGLTRRLGTMAMSGYYLDPTGQVYLAARRARQSLLAKPAK
jgi:hypothetical protein